MGRNCYIYELRGPDGLRVSFPLESAYRLVIDIRDHLANRLRQKNLMEHRLVERLVVGRGADARDIRHRVRITPVPSRGRADHNLSISTIAVECIHGGSVDADQLMQGIEGLRVVHGSRGNALDVVLTSTKKSAYGEWIERSSHVFRSVTPVVLPDVDGHRFGTLSERALSVRVSKRQRLSARVAQSLRHAHVRTRPSAIRVQREALQRGGIRAENFADGSRFSERSLWHLELRFRERVPGPLVLGNGRFCGLGVMQPSLTHSDVVSYEIVRNERFAARHRTVIIRSLRRALMAIARDLYGQVGLLFSGHYSDGRVDRSGHHAHIFIGADGGSIADEKIGRLFVAAPWAGDRRVNPLQRNQRQFDEVTGALAELTVGRLGRLTQLRGEAVEEGDPLLGPARQWRTESAYVATRNLKRHDDLIRSVKADLAIECNRRGFPTPIEIEVLEVVAGPHGGRPSARLKLRFADSIRGPLLLGRDSHLGGGLFHAVGL